MSAVVDTAFGSSVTFDTGFLAKILSWDWSGAVRESHETTAFDSTAPSTGEVGGKTYMPDDLADPGELSVEILYNPDDPPPLEKVAESITLQLKPSGGDSTGGKIVGEGYLTNFSVVGPRAGLMVATAVIKWTGVLVVTAGAI